MESGYIYFVHADGTNRYKIGLTNNLDRRMKELNGKQSPVENRLQWSIEVCDMRSAEKDLHDRFHARRVHGEWFQFSEGELKEVESVYDRVGDKYPSRRHQPEPGYPQPQYSSDREKGSGCLLMGAIAIAIAAGVSIAMGHGSTLPALPTISAQATTSQRANVRQVPNGKIICVLPANQQIKLSNEKDGWYQTEACGGGVIHESVVANQPPKNGVAKK